MTQHTTEETLQDEREVKRIVWIVVLFLLVVAAFVLQLFAYLNSRDALHEARHANTTLRETNKTLRRQAAQGKQAHDYLCRQREDVRDRIASIDDLTKHPEKLRDFGLSDSPATIAALKTQRAGLVRTRRLLRVVVCTGASKPQPKP